MFWTSIETGWPPGKPPLQDENESYFHVVMFTMLYKVVLTLNLWVKSQCVTIQIKAMEQYFHVV